MARTKTKPRTHSRVLLVDHLCCFCFCIALSRLLLLFWRDISPTTAHGFEIFSFFFFLPALFFLLSLLSLSYQCQGTNRKNIFCYFRFFALLWADFIISYAVPPFMIQFHDPFFLPLYRAETG